MSKQQGLRGVYTRDLTTISGFYGAFEVVTLDIVSGFPTLQCDFDAIVDFADRSIKRAFIEPCTKTASAGDLAQIILHRYFDLKVCRAFLSPIAGRNV